MNTIIFQLKSNIAVIKACNHSSSLFSTILGTSRYEPNLAQRSYW